jgi:hypothetical protein
MYLVGTVVVFTTFGYELVSVPSIKYLGVAASVLVRASPLLLRTAGATICPSGYNRYYELRSAYDIPN